MFAQMMASGGGGGDAYTAILPYAVDYEDDTPVHLLDGTDKTIAINGAPTYGEPRVLAVDLTSMYDLQEEDITSANLRQRANTYLSENNLKAISHNIEISFVQLWQTEEYKHLKNFEKIGMADSVGVIYNDYNFVVKVVQYSFDVLVERYRSMTLGQKKETLLQSIRKYA